MSSSKHSVSSFQSSWLSHPVYGKWVQAVSGQPRLAKCRYCCKEIKIACGGLDSLRSHAAGKTHQSMEQLTASSAQTTMVGFFSQQPNITADVAGVNSSAGTDVATPSPGHSTPCVSSVEVKQFAERAVVLWALKTVANHFSYRSVDDMPELFRAMFPDSKVAAQMALKRTKLRYTIVYGIAPFFKQQLMSQLQTCPVVVVCFDEALNKVAQRGQMDLHVRFWDILRNRVCSSYLNSVFMGRATANDLSLALKAGIAPIPQSKIQQISMDGPNVNHKFYNDLKSDVSLSAGDPAMIDTGSCGLHVVSGAFQAGNRVVKWDINTFLRSLHWLFKDTPSRRALYTALTGSSLWPLKFCTVRWVENAAVAERAIKMFPHLKKWFENLKSPLNNLAFDAVRKAVVEDKLFLAKLHFFHYVASQLEPFLTQFQTARPMFPMLNGALTKLVRNMMGMYIKKDVLAAATSQSKLMRLQENLKDDQLLVSVEFGFACRTALNGPNVTQSMRVGFTVDSRKFLKGIVDKIIERAPIRYQFVRSAAALSPTLFNSSPTTSRKRMEDLLTVLIDCNRISTTDADKVKMQFEDFCSDTSVIRSMSSFKLQDTRLDDFYTGLLSDKDGFGELWSVVKQVLIMSHGNATVEGGFSVNADMLIENMKEESLVAQRRVYDAVRHAGGPLNVDITPELMKSVAGSNRRYRLALESRAVNEAKAEEQLKRKQKCDVAALEELKKRKKAVEAEQAAQSRELAAQIREVEDSLRK